MLSENVRKRSSLKEGEGGGGGGSHHSKISKVFSPHSEHLSSSHTHTQKKVEEFLFNFLTKYIQNVVAYIAYFYTP